jgi:hypothetical protein
MPERGSERANELAGEVAAVAGRYRLQNAGRRFRGRSGSRRGSASGSSLEFLDTRDYAPGDDLRHIDWRGLARTDKLRVRLHEEEVAPFVDLLVDSSASLASTPIKEYAVHALVLALLAWARTEGAAARVLELGGGCLDPAQLRFVGTATSPSLPSVALRRAGVRVLISDALWAGDPGAFLRCVAADAARFVCLQVLDASEWAPAPASALTLVDCETGQRRELRLDAARIADYAQRLSRLVDAVRSSVLGSGGTWVRVTADALPAMCSRDLLPAGVLVPA